MAEKGMGGREGSIQEVHLQDLANIELVDWRRKSKTFRT